MRRFFHLHVFFLSLFGFAPSIAGAQVPLGPLIVSGYVQSDGLFSPSGDPFGREDSFRLRRARFSVKGALTDRIAWESSFELTSSPVLRDAFVTFRAARWARLAAGQFVTPFSLERLTSTARLEAIDRALDTLTSSRDIGFGVESAEPIGGSLTYGVAVVNGVGQNEPDDNAAKDVVARVGFIVPGVSGVTVGVNGTTGEQPDGRRSRHGADVEVKAGGLRLVGEFLRESNAVAPDRDGIYLLALHRWEAVELVGRVARLRNGGESRRRVELGGNYYFAARTRVMGALFLEPDLPDDAVGIAVRVQFAF